MMTIDHGTACVNGVRLHFAHAGAGPLIMFLHGFPEFWRCWTPQLLEFGRDRFAVAPDLRGFNLSDRPAAVEQYKARVLIEDIRQLSRHLSGAAPDQQKFTLVAHDWGGAVAWGFAIAHPELLDKLVIINSPHPVMFARELGANKAQQDASQYMNLLRSEKAERLLSDNNFARLSKMTLDAWSRGAPDPVEAEAYRAAWSQPGALTGGLNYYRASPFYPPPRTSGT